MEQIQSAQYSGLLWEDDSRSMFRIPWKHAGKQDYNQEVDASIFKVCFGFTRISACNELGLKWLVHNLIFQILLFGVWMEMII